MRLAEDRFYNTYPCIIITAKGQPDVASRWDCCPGFCVVHHKSYLMNSIRNLLGRFTGYFSGSSRTLCAFLSWH